jgi:C4-dicarboxylate transporter DctQ subunit
VLLGLFISGVLFVYSWQHAMRALYLGDSTIDAQIPLWPSKLIVPIALGMLFVRLLISLWAYLRILIDPSKPAVAVAEVIDAEEQALREAASAGAFDDGTAQAHHSRAGRG